MNLLDKSALQAIAGHGTSGLDVAAKQASRPAEYRAHLLPVSAWVMLTASGKASSGLNGHRACQKNIAPVS